MFLSKIIKASIAIGLMLGGAYSAAALETLGKEHSHAHKGYFKPGAAVELTSDYDGKTQPGELENLTLKLQHYYRDGYISARFIETEGLDIFSYQTLENEKLIDETALLLPIQLSGTQLGEHFISLEITYESLSGDRTMRVLSLPVQIGERQKSKGETTSFQQPKSSHQDGFVIFEATETIR